jgi:hypothetical protein
VHRRRGARMHHEGHEDARNPQSQPSSPQHMMLSCCNTVRLFALGRSGSSQARWQRQCAGRELARVTRGQLAWSVNCRDARPRCRVVFVSTRLTGPRTTSPGVLLHCAPRTRSVESAPLSAEVGGRVVWVCRTGRARWQPSLCAPAASGVGARRKAPASPCHIFKVPVLHEDCRPSASAAPACRSGLQHGRSNSGSRSPRCARRPGVRVFSGRVESGRAGETGALGRAEPERGRARPKAVRSARPALRQRTRPGRCFLTADILLAAPPPGIRHLRLRRHRRHVP